MTAHKPNKKHDGYFRVKANENAPKFFGMIGLVSLQYKNRKHVKEVPVEFPIEGGKIKAWLHWSQIDEI